MQFTSGGSDGGAAGPFAPLAFVGGIGNTSGATAAWSGSGPGYGVAFEYPPTPWTRIALTGSTTVPTTFTLHTLVR